jgi:hypothetical protein
MMVDCGRKNEGGRNHTESITPKAEKKNNLNIQNIGPIK